MDLKENSRQSIKGAAIRTGVFMAFVFFAAIFFVDSMSAQAAETQTYRLIGSIQSKDFTGAVLSDAKGAQVVYGLREKLPDGSQIIAVRPESISLKGEDGSVYDIYISHETKTVASSNPGSSPTPPSNPGLNAGSTTEAPAHQYSLTPTQEIFAEKQKQRRLNRAQRTKEEM